MSAVSSVASSIASEFESRSGPRPVVRGPQQAAFRGSARWRGVLSMRRRQSARRALLLPAFLVACLVADPVVAGLPDVPTFARNSREKLGSRRESRVE